VVLAQHPDFDVGHLERIEEGVLLGQLAQVPAFGGNGAVGIDDGRFVRNGALEEGGVAFQVGFHRLLDELLELRLGWCSDRNRREERHEQGGNEGCSH
jgi:hypothetical protein